MSASRRQIMPASTRPILLAMQGSAAGDRAKSRWRRIVRWAGVIAGWGVSIIAAASIVAWLVGRVLTDRYGWSQWLWWTPTPAAIGLALLGVAASLRPARTPRRRRRRLVTWTAVFAALAGYFSIIEHRFLAQREPVTDATALRIAHWNLAHPNDRQSPLYVQGLNRIDGDVIVLTSANDVPRSDDVRARFGDGWTIRGLGVFQIITRLPIRSVEHVHLGGELDRVFISVVVLDASQSIGGELVVYLVDLPSELWRPRAMIASEVTMLLQGAESPPPDIVVGDFNMTRGSASIARMFPGTRHAFDEAGTGYGATFPRGRPFLHIDHILLGPRVAALAYDLIDPGAGHHVAQAATIVARRAASPR
jgi:hypothetical protein